MVRPCNMLYLNYMNDMIPVRKAYKKRALATHPDRNPKLAKDVAEEGFRKVYDY
jgi:DnaJ-class molecular chaperone